MAEHHHIGQAIIVIDIGIEIARLAGHRIQQQIFGNRFLLVGNLEECRIVAVHRLIHALDEFRDRHHFADVGLPGDKFLQLVHRFQHGRIFDRVRLIAFDKQINVIGARHALIEFRVTLQQRQARIKVFFQRTFNGKAVHTEQRDNNGDTGHDKDAITLRAQQSIGIKIREAIPKAFFALHPRFLLARRWQYRTQRGN